MTDKKTLAHMEKMRSKRGSKPKPTHKGRATDRRQPRELRTRSDAIKSFCSECITAYGLDCGGAGSIAAAIKLCSSTQCHLWPYRNGPVDPDAAIK